MSVMGLKKNWMGGGFFELSKFILDFWSVFNFAKPLSAPIIFLCSTWSAVAGGGGVCCSSLDRASRNDSGKI